jgi:hypothetical protein
VDIYAIKEPMALLMNPLNHRSRGCRRCASGWQMTLALIVMTAQEHQLLVRSVVLSLLSRQWERRKRMADKFGRPWEAKESSEIHFREEYKIWNICMDNGMSVIDRVPEAVADLIVSAVNEQFEREQKENP